MSACDRRTDRRTDSIPTIANSWVSWAPRVRSRKTSALGKPDADLFIVRTDGRAKVTVPSWNLGIQGLQLRWRPVKIGRISVSNSHCEILSTLMRLCTYRYDTVLKVIWRSSEAQALRAFMRRLMRHLSDLQRSKRLVFPGRTATQKIFMVALYFWFTSAFAHFISELFYSKILP